MHWKLKGCFGRHICAIGNIPAHTHTFSQTHTLTPTRTHTHTHTYKYAHTHTHTHTHTHANTHRQTHGTHTIQTNKHKFNTVTSAATKT